MAASASDVRSILALPTPHAGPSQKRVLVPPPTPTSSKKPEGISRELYSLIGDAAPPLIPQYAKPKLMQRPDFGKGKTRWQWKPFANGARTDNLKLFHWAKAITENEQADYPFAKFNTTTVNYTYSLDEYTRLLEEPGWTKEETDYLFGLVAEYEMRWYVIHDRYCFPNDHPRDIDDLKARYYGVVKKLLKSRPWGGDEVSKNRLLDLYTFDKEREVSRKDYVNSLLSRTSEQIEEEEALFIEIKRLEQTERRFAKERNHLLRTLFGIDSGLSLQLDDDGPVAAQLVADKKKGKRKVDGIEIEPSLASLSSMPSLRKSTIVKGNAQDLQHCIQRFEIQPNASNKSGNIPVFLRSTKTPQPKSALAPKVSMLLDEMGLGYSKLVMPTQNNLAQLKGLFEAAEALIETKRALDRVEQEIAVFKRRREGSGRDSTDADTDQMRGTSELHRTPDAENRTPPVETVITNTMGVQEQEQNSDDELDARMQVDDEDEMHQGVGGGPIQGEEEGEEGEEGDERLHTENDEDDLERLTDPDVDDEEGNNLGLEEDEVDDAEAEYEDADADADADAEGDGDGDGDWDEGEVQNRHGTRKRALSNSSLETSGTTMTRRSSKRHRSGN